MSPLMISPGQVRVVEAGTSTSMWVERAGHYAAAPDGDVDNGTHDLIRVEADDGADHRREGPHHDAPRSIRTVFADATAAYGAVDELRARGFRIDLAASIAGDLIVTIQAARTRADEVGALVAAHDGRVETASPMRARA